MKISEFEQLVKVFHAKIGAERSGYLDFTPLKIQHFGKRCLKFSKELEKTGEIQKNIKVLRIHLMLEELGEFLLASDEVEAFDAALDLLYVTIGTFVTFDWPLIEGFEEVQKSNMTKIQIDSLDVRCREKGFLYTPPNLKKVLNDYRRRP